MKTTVLYSAKGVILGHFWEGGEGCYPTIELKDYKSEKELLNYIKDNFESLDSGMGFKDIFAALMNITKHTTKVIDSKEYKRQDSELEFFGDADEKQQDFMQESLMNYDI